VNHYRHIELVQVNPMQDADIGKARDGILPLPACPPSILPRLIRVRDAPAYCGIDRNKFNRELRPHLTEIPLGKQAIAFDRIELDALIDDYISRNGRRPKASQLEDDTCQNVTKCRGSASKAVSGTSKNAVSTAKEAGSGRARAHLAALKQKKS
jgi:hypothetical protein